MRSTAPAGRLQRESRAREGAEQLPGLLAPRAPSRAAGEPPASSPGLPDHRLTTAACRQRRRINEAHPGQALVQGLRGAWVAGAPEARAAIVQVRSRQAVPQRAPPNRVAAASASCSAGARPPRPTAHTAHTWDDACTLHASAAQLRVMPAGRLLLAPRHRLSPLWMAAPVCASHTRPASGSTGRRWRQDCGGRAARPSAAEMTGGAAAPGRPSFSVRFTTQSHSKHHAGRRAGSSEAKRCSESAPHAARPREATRVTAAALRFAGGCVRQAVARAGGSTKHCRHSTTTLDALSGQPAIFASEQGYQQLPSASLTLSVLMSPESCAQPTSAP